MLGIGFVCFLVGGLMFSSAFVCFCLDLCWALGLSVCLLGHLFLKCLCYLEQAQLIICFWNIW